MNRIYKVIWSKVKNSYVVVSEVVRSHSKNVSGRGTAKSLAALMTVLALCTGITTGSMAADKYYSVDDFEGRLASMGNADNSGAKGIGSMAAGIGSSVQSSSMFQGAMSTVVGALNTVAVESNEKGFDGVANSIVGVANATQNANATLIFGAGNAVSNSYGDVNLDISSINPADPVGTARKLGAAVGDSGGQVLVIGGANAIDYARFSAVTGVSNTLNGKDGNTSDYNFITGAKNTLTNADGTYVIGSSNTVSDGTSNVVIGDKRKLTGATNDVVIGSADDETETTVSDATILGHNANATVADGVALGSNSVANVAKGVAGTVPTGATVSDTDKASATWTSTLGAVSVGVISSDGTATKTRQITGVAAGTNATDAVNVAQLNAVNTVVASNTTSISNLNTAVEANKIRFFSVTGRDSAANSNNEGARGWTSLAVGPSSVADADFSANVGIGVSTQGFHSSAFGTGNHSLAGIVQRIPNLQAETSIEYTYQRDANGKFIDRTMWGGFSTLLGNSNAIVSKDLMNLTTPLDGFGNTLVGTNNKTRVANGSYMFGWNNTVYNSYFTDDEKLPTQFNGIFKVNSESFGGSVVAIGMDNTVNGAQHSYIMGTGNTVQGKLISKPNGVLEDVEEVATDNIVIGDKHKVDNASHTIIVGSADTETTIDQDGVVVIGHNANATAADGVALGSNSVASVAAGVAGYDPTTKTASTDTSATWKSTLGAVSVGVIGSDGTATATRQITGVAAGTNATDAVNVAQLTAVNTKVDANTTKITNLTTTVEGNKTHFFHVNQGTSGTNYNNDGAKGTNSIAIGKASTAGDNSVIIGQGSIANTGSGDIAIGMAVQVNSYANQGGGIAIGYNARSENMAGQQERYLSLGQSEYTTGIAIGRNSFARSGSTMVGTHNYSGAIGDVTLSSNPASSMLQPNLNPFATTVGANSFNSGTMSTVMGVYSIASSNYTGNNDSGKAPKNFGATIMGSLNSIESATADSNRAGVANSIVGLANRANNANGALIFGAGNEITNSVTPIVVPLDASIASAKDLQTNLISSIRASNSAGSTMAMGGGNKADYTQLTSIMGVNNTVTGTSDDISQYNYISGFNNTATNTDNVTVTGTNRNVTGANNTILIGSADSTIETTASDAVAVGRNSNVTVDGGVALGANSVARIDKGVVGYDQSGKITDASSLTYDREKYQSLQTQMADTQTSITSLNKELAELQEGITFYEKWYSNYEEIEQYQTMKAQYESKQSELATTISNLDTIETEIGEVLKPVNTWQSTDAAVSVGDVSKGITRQITDVAAGTNDTDAVNVAQLKAAKVEVIAGDNVTVSSDNSEGYTKYTVKATDTQVTGLSLDNNTLTLTQNGLADLKVEGIATTTDLANNKTHYFHVNSAANGTNYNNDGAKGTDSIAIGKASTAADNSIAIGNGASVSDSSGGKGSGDIAIGNGAKINNYVDQSASIAIGQNAQIDNMTGNQEALFSMGQTVYDTKIEIFPPSIKYTPKDPSKVATGIAIGENTFVRTGGLMVGTHNYRGALGDVTVDSANIRVTGLNINSTTLGTNSYNGGAFATITGAYSIASSDYNGGTSGVAKAGKNFGATIMGSLNSVESATASSNYSGVANSIVGTANRTFNSNGSLIFGAGNEITNSVTTINAPTSAGDSAKALQDKLMTAIKSSNSGGSTLAIGGANKADYTQQSALIGVNNTLTGTSSNISQYNYITGFNNTGTNVDNVTIIGTNRTVSDAANSVVIGSADSVMTSSASDAVTLGRNANTTVDGGVALGASSVASVDKGVDGYNPSTKALTGSTWTSTLAAVSVGDVANDITRQITSVAAGTADTDAVNVAQLKANKVDLKQGENVTITSEVADDGSTTYTIKSTDTNTVLASGTVSYAGADGTLVLTDSDNNQVTVKGLKNIYLTEASLENGTLTLTQNEGDPIKVTGIATTAELEANKVKYFSVKSELTDNQNNDGAKGLNSVAIGPNAVAQRENGIALGTNVYSGGKGSIVIGSDSKVLENIALEGSIVIGKGASAFTGGGEQEALLGMDPTNWPGRGVGGYDNPTDPSRVATSIVIGTNASGRTGSIDIGDRVYRGTMGGRKITDNNSSFHVNQTTLGTNTYNKGLFSTMVGSYSIATGDFDGSGRMNTWTYGAQNFGATVMGSLNSIRSNGNSTQTSYQGIANTIVGLGNITDNSNGSLVFGAGNKITNSITSISMPTSGADSVDAMVDKLQTTIKNSGSGGSTLAIGGGNTADYTQWTSIIGVNNTVTGTSGNVSKYNFVSGYKNTVTGSNNATVIGTNRKLTGVDNTIVIGSADSVMTSSASDAVTLGRNANTTVDGGVALGAKSIASVDKGIIGYDPSGKITDADSILGTNTQYQSLQTEVTAAQTTVNDLTAKAAEYQANIDMIVSMYPDNSYEQDAGYQGIKASLEETQTQLVTAQADLDSKQSALAEAGKALYTWQSTAGAVSVGDVSKGITRQITNVAAGTEDTDAVNVAQLKKVAEAATEAGKTTLKFTGDDTTAEISRGNGDTLNIIGGATATDADGNSLLTDDNIGVVKDGDNALKIKLAKDLQDLNSVRIGGTSTDGKGIYIANQTVKNSKGADEKGNYITGLENKEWDPDKGIVSGRAATEDQLNSVYNRITSEVKANKVIEGKNIEVKSDANGTKVSLKDDITLGDKDGNGKNVAISGTNGTITAGDGADNQVAIDGTKSTITAGTGENKVTVDGKSGLVTVGDADKGAISIGNQTVTPKKTDDKGNVTDGTAKEGRYITGLENTTWNPTGEGYVADRAATEGQLKDIADKISEIDTNIKDTSRVYESDSGSAEQVTRKNTQAMKLKGGADGELSDDNIGVVNNSDKSGFDIKLAKNIEGLNSISVENKDEPLNKTTITGGTITTGSITMGGTTIDESGMKINDGPSVTKGGIDAGSNKITNVADGEISATSKDAVNGSQLYNTKQAIYNINNTVNTLGGRVDRVGAGAAALASLNPLDFDPEDKWNFAAGFGHYKGANATAIGAYYRPNENTMFSIGGAFGGGENMWNAGISVKLGSGDTLTTSRTAMAREIESLKSQNQEMRDELEALKQQIAALAAK